jgi:hypothetical protein
MVIDPKNQWTSELAIVAGNRHGLLAWTDTIALDWAITWVNRGTWPMAKI